jgi:homoserine O-acetyltransferase
MAGARPSAAASPRLFDLRLPPLTLLDGAVVDPHHSRVQWWGPETDGPVLERLGTQVSPEATGPVVRSAPLPAGTGAGLDPSVPTVLVVHALTADARRGSGRLVGTAHRPRPAARPARLRILCANNLGSCYGSSGPLDAWWPERVVRLTPWDQARALWSLLDVLGLERLRLTTGASLGGMIALCLPVLRPGAVERLLPIGTSSASSAWVSGWNHVARQILRLDPGWPSDVGRGLELARQLAMLTYRAEPSLDARQHRTAGRHPDPPWTLPIQSYLEYQGKKLRRRFDGRAYLLQLDAMDVHDLDAPPPGTPGGPLRASALCVDIDTDQLFTPAQVDVLADWLTAHGAEARRATVRSPHGHDAFLIEWDALDPLVRLALGNPP